MRIGSINFATDQGLGVLLRDFHANGIVTDVLLVRHRHRTNHREWFPGADIIGGRLWKDDRQSIERFLDGLDALLLFETPFHWEVLNVCRERGIRTALMPMYECMPKELPVQPDVIINPSLLDQQYYPQGVFIPVPVNEPWRLRERANVFVHNAGNGGLKSRNGTGELLDAMKYVASPIKLILRSQVKLQWGVDDPRIDLRVGNFAKETLYDEGDVFIFPEKFNGLSLPLQEACASGMLVMAGDRFPMNTWLPREPLIPIAGTEKESISGRCNEYDAARYDPGEIASTIDTWASRNITEFSQGGREWALRHSWDALRPRYLEALS